MKTLFPLSLIVASNYRAQVAILAVRLLGRNLATMAEVRDALNSRRRMRSAGLTQAEADALGAAVASDLRTYGRVEHTPAELHRIALNHSLEK